MRLSTFFLIVLLCLPLWTAPAARAESPFLAPGIAWIPTWNQGIEEARHTGKPMLVMSAAPQCHNVPGVW